MTDADSSSGPMTSRFIDALRRLEADGDADALVALYATDGTAGNVINPDAGSGADGVRRFWEHYRASFDDIRSEFRVEIEAGGAGALEWRSQGTIKGRPVDYAGVTMLEFADGAVTRSCAYFDPTAIADQALHGDPA